jgi:hypothetical protein
LEEIVPTIIEDRIDARLFAHQRRRHNIDKKVRRYVLVGHSPKDEFAAILAANVEEVIKKARSNHSSFFNPPLHWTELVRRHQEIKAGDHCEFFVNASWGVCKPIWRPEEPASGERLEAYVEALNEKGLSNSAEKAKLQIEIRLLERQLHSDRPYLQLYRLGAASLVVSVLSLVVWALTGVGAPFHPIFAAGVIPAAVGVMLMAFLTKPKEEDRDQEDENQAGTLAV